MVKINALLVLLTLTAHGVLSAPASSSLKSERDYQINPGSNWETRSTDLTPVPGSSNKREAAIELGERDESGVPSYNSDTNSIDPPSSSPYKKRDDPITIFYDDQGNVRVYFAVAYGATVANRLLQQAQNLANTVGSSAANFIRNVFPFPFAGESITQGITLASGGDNMQRINMGLQFRTAGIQVDDFVRHLEDYARQNRNINIESLNVADAFDDDENLGPAFNGRRDFNKRDILEERQGQDYCQNPIQSAWNLISGKASGMQDPHTWKC
ncbi:MAG: hypothetical protein Q9227_002333 [Pyrenula ochraceoflavens]